MGIVIGVILALLVAVASGVIVKNDEAILRGCTRYIEHIRDLPNRRRRRKQSADRDRLIKAVLAKATKTGKPVWVRLRGVNPVIAVNNQGGEIACFSDLPTYRRACEIGQADPRTSSPASPPKTIYQMSEDELHALLDDLAG